MTDKQVLAVMAAIIYGSISAKDIGYSRGAAVGDAKILMEIVNQSSDLAPR